MPITSKGAKLKKALHAQYGKKEGDRVFYKMANSGRADWAHQKGKRK